MTKRYGKNSVKKQIKSYTYRRKDGRLIKVPTHKRTYHMSQYKLNQMRNKTIIEQQIKEKDWAHLSANYPNLIGFTDEEVEKFIEYMIKNKSSKENERKELEEYISKIRCYNKEDFRELSIKMYNEFIKRNNSQYNYDYNTNKTAYVTSPRGGFEVLSTFAYANRLDKSNLPVDFYDREDENPPFTKMYMASRSLPYGASIKDIDDIVYIDDICMSGEQQDKAYSKLDHMIKGLKISPEERPRLHYMAFVGSKDKIVIDEKTGRRSVEPLQPWDSVTLGEERDFTYTKELNKTTGKFDETTKKYNDISATMFPYGVPDGNRHHKASMLYKHYKS